MQVPGRSGPEAARREPGGTGARRAPRAMAGGAGGCKTGDAGAPHQSEPTPLGGGRRQRDPHAPGAGSLGQRGWHVSAELREGVGTLADSASGSLGFTKSAELSAAPPADASHTDGPSRGHTHTPSRGHTHTPSCGHTHTPSRGHAHTPSRGLTRRHPLAHVSRRVQLVSTRGPGGVPHAEARRAQHSGLARARPSQADPPDPGHMVRNGSFCPDRYGSKAS